MPTMYEVMSVTEYEKESFHIDRGHTRTEWRSKYAFLIQYSC